MVKVRRNVGGRRATFTFPMVIEWYGNRLTYYKNFTSEREAKSMVSSLDNRDYPATVRTITTTIPNPKDPRKPNFRQIFVVYRGKKRREK